MKRSTFWTLCACGAVFVAGVVLYQYYDRNNELAYETPYRTAPRTAALDRESLNVPDRQGEAAGLQENEHNIVYDDNQLSALDQLEQQGARYYYQYGSTFRWPNLTNLTGKGQGTTGTTGTTPGKGSTTQKPTGTTTPATNDSYEKQVLTLVNQERSKAKLPALTLNTSLSNVARTKAAEMRDKGYFSHTSPTYGSPSNMITKFGIKWSATAENIAKGQKTPQAVMSSWMGSAGHKTNIMNKTYTQIGIGYVTDAKGNTYWVQMFIKP